MVIINKQTFKSNLPQQLGPVACKTSLTNEHHAFESDNRNTLVIPPANPYPEHRLNHHQNKHQNRPKLAPTKRPFRGGLLGIYTILRATFRCKLHRQRVSETYFFPKVSKNGVLNTCFQRLILTANFGSDFGKDFDR